jgi:hypothetical protein
MDYWNGKCIYERNTDWDFICNKEDLSYLRDVLAGQKVEGHFPEHLNNKAIYDYYTDAYEGADITAVSDKLDGWGHFFIAPPMALYVFKRSHAWRRRGFEKVISHLHLGGLAKQRILMEEHDKHLLEERTKLTLEAYPQRNPKLNQTVKDFFDDPVKKVVEHDWIHELYAFEEKPMFTRLQPDSTRAWCAKDLWLGLTDLQRTQCVAEESYVIATERFLVHSYRYPKKLAFFKALEKVCTTLCSGWFRDWAIDYYPDVINLYSESKVERVLERIRLEGHLHPYKGKDE